MAVAVAVWLGRAKVKAGRARGDERVLARGRTDRVGRVWRRARPTSGNDEAGLATSSVRTVREAMVVVEREAKRSEAMRCDAMRWERVQARSVGFPALAGDSHTRVISHAGWLAGVVEM